MVIASFGGWWGVCVLQQFLFMNPALSGVWFSREVF